jgi:hypothetical protein
MFRAGSSSAETPIFVRSGAGSRISWNATGTLRVVHRPVTQLRYRVGVGLQRSPDVRNVAVGVANGFGLIRVVRTGEQYRPAPEERFNKMRWIAERFPYEMGDGCFTSKIRERGIHGSSQQRAGQQVGPPGPGGMHGKGDPCDEA